MRRRCVILGDTQQNTLESIRGLLESVFDKIVMVSNLASLLEAVKKIKPKYVVIDFSLLAAAGINAIGEIKKLLPDLKVIVLSFDNEPEIIEDVMSAGASGFVLKQHAGTDLFTAIKTAQEEGTFISPAAQQG